eukprot:CAMPEP_0117673218 /NCGR_PEP_ID=MMETSP0804-20121206/14350_1 /TAXON_ID=1074897 /ORGANISM="Tetraselmis astigmatica, Strain CCMP880" /LENGTH=328 /DNA_ID=CAMNT_0005481931 /DNA_START=296 /DNA_END=1283 /DNA_ORIENTATION=+
MVEELKSNKMYGGFNTRYQHDSKACGCKMTFTVFFPPAAATEKVPVIYYLSGLTCTDENVIQKSGIQKKAAELGVAIIAPDTSPRGHNIDGEAENYDFGVGAGFYLNATVEKWKNWRMYEYITEELPAALATLPGLDVTKAGITGHSMGGHGALTIFLKNPTKYKSLSAFSPICNPMIVPWGEKALTGYLGEDKEAWKEYDATELLKGFNGKCVPVLIDIGTSDNFMHQLSPQTFASVAMEKNIPITMRMQEGYDHSYFFIQTFVDDHVEHHAKMLKAESSNTVVAWHTVSAQLGYALEGEGLDCKSRSLFVKFFAIREQDSMQNTAG